GFPGETDQDFADTLALVEEVEYGQSYSFKYSARPGTPAAEKAELPSAIADARLQNLQSLLTQQQRAVQDRMVGRRVKVLFEKPGRLEGQMVGKSEYLHAVHVHAPDAVRGDLVEVEIMESAPNSLAGRLVA
ncbi:MAG: TRAM domain-containing protein, partial [Dinoroseobacter sp.]|nr:TRAM domain-containing protein [Dinoroseobacter sp.]